MIPSTYQFQNIYGEPGLHPDVAAEIAAARREQEDRRDVRTSRFATWLRRLVSPRASRHDAVLVPAE